MPTGGFALIGFMARDQALTFLKEACCPVDPDDAVLEDIWNSARLALGNSVPHAGRPHIIDIPVAGQPYVDALRSGIWQPTFAQKADWDIKLVEIEPLLAFQLSVDVPRSAHHCGHMKSPPTLEGLLGLALPQVPTQEQIGLVQKPDSIVLKSKSLNVQCQIQGADGQSILVMQFGVALPFVQVVRLDGRCYLHNGYHRTYGAMNAGAKFIPAIIRDVPDAPSAGIRIDGKTIDLQTLESGRPPTMASFNKPGSCAVKLRAMTRVINVNWTEHFIPDE